jgi:hypothetical protein
MQIKNAKLRRSIVNLVEDVAADPSANGGAADM